MVFYRRMMSSLSEQQPRIGKQWNQKTLRLYSCFTPKWYFLYKDLHICTLWLVSLKQYQWRLVSNFWEIASPTCPRSSDWLVYLWFVFRKFPHYYHKKTISLPSGPSLDLLLIDTVQLCGNVYTIEQQPAGPADVAKAEEQWAWIEAELKQSR